MIWETEKNFSSGLNALGMILKACAYKPGLFALVMVGQAFSALSKLGFNNKKVLPNLIRSKLDLATLYQWE